MGFIPCALILPILIVVLYRLFCLAFKTFSTVLLVLKRPKFYEHHYIYLTNWNNWTNHHGYSPTVSINVFQVENLLLSLLTNLIPTNPRRRLEFLDDGEKNMILVLFLVLEWWKMVIINAQWLFWVLNIFWSKIVASSTHKCMISVECQHI